MRGNPGLEERGELELYDLVADPNETTDLTPARFLRIPLEGLLGVALVLFLPSRPRRIVAICGGVFLGHQDAVWHSSDGGHNWDVVREGLTRVTCIA